MSNSKIDKKRLVSPGIGTKPITFISGILILKKRVNVTITSTVLNNQMIYLIIWSTNIHFLSKIITFTYITAVHTYKISWEHLNSNMQNSKRFN